MQKSIVTILVFASVLLVNSVYADSVCLKGYGNTPAEALQAGAELLENKDAEMGPGWMKDNMQIRILPNKEKGQFVAVAYSVYHQDTCDLNPVRKVADTARPECDKTKCRI